MKSNHKFWDRIANKYARDTIANQVAYERKLAITQKLFQPGFEVVELGCGTGSTAILHAPHVKHIRAVDVSAKMLAIARQRAADAGVENIYFEQSTVEDLKLSDGAADMVLALSLLHLVDDRDVTISQMYRALKPGGYFVSSTACLGDWLKWMAYVAPIGQAVGLLPPLKVFGVAALKDSIIGAGFDIVEDWAPDRKAAHFIVARKPG